jgi:hypothetical protein
MKQMKHNLSVIGVIGLLCLSACGGDSGSPAPTVTIKVSPGSVAANQDATLTWTSSNASTCQASGAWGGSIPTSGSTNVSPQALGTYTYALSCSSGAGATATGAAILTVTLAIVPGALPNGVIGAPFDQSIQAAGGGVAPFTWKISSGALPHGLSLVPSTSSTVTIFGTPDTPAQGVAFTLQVTDSAHNTTSQSFTVSILLQPDSLVLSPAAGLDFGNQLVGSASATLTETLTNSATSDMVINSITVAPTAANAGEFKQTGSTCGASLAAGTSCTVSLGFTPGQTGPRSATLTINDDTVGSPQSVVLGGVGLSTGPNATLLGTGLIFGTQLVGTTSPAQTLALTNYGAVALNVGSVTASSSFVETDTCVPSLASGATCTISVTFVPGGSGNVTGTLSISDDAVGSPQKASLSGTGSTMTPLLTGACFACRSVKSSQCPVGAPSETPVSVPSMCGGGCQLGICGQVTVDAARACSMDGPPWHGHCEAE